MTRTRRFDFRKGITLGACIGFCFMYPLSFSTTGLFLVELRSHHRLENKAITWIAAFQSGVGGATGIFTGYLIKRFGAQRVAVLATLIAVLGLLTGPLVDNIYYLYASFGVMFGIGSCAFVMVGFTKALQVFPRHRPLVSGVLASSISVGGFLWAPVTELLIQQLTWRGALIILAGVHLHGFLLSLLMLTPSPPTVTSSASDTNGQAKGFADTSVQDRDFADTSVNDKGFADTSVQDRDFADTSVKDKGFAYTSVKDKGFADNTGKDRDSENGDINKAAEDKHFIVTNGHLDETACDRSAIQLHTGEQAMDSRPYPIQCRSAGESSSSAGQCRLTEEESTPHPVQCRLDWRVAGALIMLASPLESVCHMNLYTYIPVLNQQGGFSQQQGALLLSVTNLSSALCRLPAGLLGNVPGVSCSVLYAVSISAAALLSMTTRLCTTYPGLVAMCAVYGVCSGFYMSLLIPATLEHIPIKHMEIAIGIQGTMDGLFIFLLHSSAGYILDILGDSNTLFFIFGSCGLAAGCIVLTLFTIKRLCNKVQRTKNSLTI